MEKEILEVTKLFMEASEELVAAATMCRGDPIKQDMLKHIHDEFMKMQMRHMGLQIIIQKGYYEKQTVLAEMKAITLMTKQLADKIKRKLLPLETN